MKQGLSTRGSTCTFAKLTLIRLPPPPAPSASLAHGMEGAGPRADEALGAGHVHVLSGACCSRLSSLFLDVCPMPCRLLISCPRPLSPDLPLPLFDLVSPPALLSTCLSAPSLRSFSSLPLLASRCPWPLTPLRSLDGTHPVRTAAYKWKFSQKPPSDDAQVLTFNHLNGHQGLFTFVHGHHAAHGNAKRKFIPLAVQSIWAMRSISFFVPVYAETVVYTWEALKAEGSLEHLIDLYQPEWEHFCDRVFSGATSERVVQAFFAKGRSLARLFLTARAAALAQVCTQSTCREGPPLSAARHQVISIERQACGKWVSVRTPPWWFGVYTCLVA